MHLLNILSILAIALIIAKLLGGLLNRFGIPVVLVELLVGVALGNMTGLVGDTFANVAAEPIVKGLSELGVLFLLFLVGLETDLGQLKKVGRDATLVAFIGVLAPFALAFIVIPLVVTSSFQHTLFIAAALTATSVGITARVLHESGKLQTTSGRIILGAAVIDDVLGIIVLTIVSALVTSGSFSVTSLLFLLFKIIGFVVLMVALRFVFPKLLSAFQKIEVPGSLTITLLSFCLINAWTAEQIGLAGIVGAFAFGVLLEDTFFEGYEATKVQATQDLMKPITDFLSPIFFLVMGMGVNLSTLGTTNSMLLTFVLIICGILGKIACSLAITKDSKQRGADPLLIGLGMIPRGEVGLIFAVMGQKMGVLSPSDYAAVVGMVAVTTLTAPFLMNWRMRKQLARP